MSRRLCAWLLVGTVAAGAAVVAAAPESSGAPASATAAPARNSDRPRDMAAAIALLEQIQP